MFKYKEIFYMPDIRELQKHKIELDPEIKSLIFRIKNERMPLYLEEDELDKIFRWKLRGQYNRNKKLRLKNSNEVIKKVTELSLNIKHDDEEHELELRMKSLTILDGIGIPIASAILAVFYPENYATIVFRVWRLIFGEEKLNFSLKDYKKYLKEIKALAFQLKWNPQDVDMALWDIDQS